ncbi:MAG: adenylate/guanylate cyclase domain-containing protein [Chthoniobacter sp.]|uniref:adenylate/guanylate cyclase domain-containing protein n=1 Tax=Chthoniobacter sp. TaxID=2510640 RepID=UPI0032A5785E
MPATPDPCFADPGGARLESSNGVGWTLQGRCSLGRGPENHIVIDSPKASRRHAIIHPQDEGEFWLIDLASRNGTYRNDHRLVRPTRLRHGDRLNIGGQNFIFHQPVGPRANGDDATAMFSRSSTADATVLDLRQQNLWLLIADIMDFTSLSIEMEVEKLANIMGHWLRECHRIVEKGSGRIPKYIGDGFLACWEERGEAAAAVVAAIHEFQRLRKDSPVRFRVALHYGSITFGEQAAWGEPSMLGPEMNYVFRLEDLASKLGVGFCLSSAAREKLGDLVAAESVPGEHKLKGFDGVHRCFSVPDGE